MAVCGVLPVLAAPGALAWVGDTPPGDADAMRTALATAVAESYSIEPYETHQLSLIHLDTVDRRLERAGIRAAYDARTQTLAAVTAGGDVLEQAVGRVRWPALLDALPEGVVRAALAAPVWVRALLPVATTASHGRTFAVLNDDGKTVVRVMWWSTSAADTTAVAPRLFVLPLRGYAKEARAVTRLLRAEMSVEKAGATWFDAVPRTVQPRRHAAAMSADQPAGPAVAAALLGYLDDVEANVPGVLDDLDTEFLHDLRVAVRRTRSVLKIVGDVLPDGIAARAAPEFRWLGQLTTPTRDLDVYLLGMDAMAASIANPADLEPFAEHLRRRRAGVHRELARGLRSERFRTLGTWWRAELAAVEATAGPSAVTAAQLADRRLHRTFRSVAKRARAISAGSPAVEVHALRKKCKEMRYLLELFEPISDRRAYKQVIADFKDLQNVLGEFQDGEVQALALRVFAQEMIDSGSVHASAVLAMGDLAGRFDVRQRKARSELTARHDSYLGKAAEQHIDRVIPS